MVKEGYSVKDACHTLELCRSNYYVSLRKHMVTQEQVGDCEKDKRLVERIKRIKTDHPFWGYRRITAWLKHREGMKVNAKRVYRLMRKNDLLVKQKLHKAKRTPQRSKPRAEHPCQYWGIDMTKFMVSGLGWVYLVVVLDWFTKKIVGFDISLTSKTEDWLRALHKAINTEFEQGVRGTGLKLISDNGSQPTSRAFIKEMAQLDITQIFTSYNNPKGNADTERVMRTIKEEVIWLNEFSSLIESKETIGHWIKQDYNQFYVHSALDYLSPIEFEEQYYREAA
jgi:transposase InsO family protein